MTSNDDDYDSYGETSATGYRSEENTLITAADYLRAGTGAMFEGGASRRELFQSEVRFLRSWTQEAGHFLNQDAFKGLRPVTSGAEHEVFFNAANNTAVKLTRAGSYGHSLIEEGRSALPSEYLVRLHYQNELFGDCIRLLGILAGETNLRILTSQPWITAHSQAPTPLEEEIDDYFEDVEFLRIHSVEVAAYYNSATDIVVLDAHTQNVLRDENGKLVPIDIVIGHPGEWTRKWLGILNS